MICKTLGISPRPLKTYPIDGTVGARTTQTVPGSSYAPRALSQDPRVKFVLSGIQLGYP